MSESWPANSSCFFLPFHLGTPDRAALLARRLQASADWQPVRDPLRYLLRFVADRLNSDDPARWRCLRFSLRPEAREALGLLPPDQPYHMGEHRFQGQPEDFPFRLDGVELFCFRTSVCLLVFQVSFPRQEPLWISSAQYYLKKVSREPVTPGPDGPPATLLALACRIVAGPTDGLSPVFFHFAAPGTERANVFSRLEVPWQEDYTRELYYLRHCYREGFLLPRELPGEDRDFLRPSEDTLWGISSEAAVCLVCPELGQEDFLYTSFYRNFQQQYLFMYVLLLHQKYALYFLLGQVDTGIGEDLALLEDYRRRLYEFESDYVFSRVAEVPQYQQLYDRMRDAFALKELFEDVREPLSALSELRRTREEDERSARETGLNRCLFLLSLLVIPSALGDTLALVGALAGPVLPAAAVAALQAAGCLLVLALVAVGLCSIFRRRR